ncbi:VOC family protein [Asanoa sp. NPDC049518]|uniref:VOC family protein n=1 Tax=unclassified Asanoa TaxID=2685164 RepID=UPI0034146AA2
MEMLRGFATINYWTDDLAGAARWYADVLGVEPYFEVPGGYVEFRFGDYQQELGLVSRAYAPDGVPTGAGGVVAYWHVDDIDAALARLTELGATVREQPRDRGKGFITATVTDPFDNILGIMFNPHYREVLAGRNQ